MEKILFYAGVFCLLAGVAIFLFAYRILKPLIKTETRRDKYLNWHEKYGSMSKMLAYSLIFFGIVAIIQNNPDNFIQYTESTVSRQWTETDKQELTNECVRMYIVQEGVPESDADIAINYCECTTEKMTEEFTINDLLSHDSLSRMEKVELYEPVVENCLLDLEYQLNQRYGHSGNME